MGRTSRIPYHQNLYDLLQIEPREVPGAIEVIRAWEERERSYFPAVLTEWYVSECEIRYGTNLQHTWRISLADLWTEFSNMDGAYSLAQLLGSHNRPEHGWREPSGYQEEAYPHPFFRLIQENQGNWVLFAYADGSDDPPVFSTEGEYGGPWIDPAQESDEEPGWRQIGAFSEMLFRWFATYYIDEDFVPLSFNSHNADPSRAGLAPPKPYRDGLWLRTPAEPLAAPIIDFLTEQFGEPERALRPGNVTTYTYRPDGGTIRLTADDLAYPHPLSAWWIHTDTPERLAEFARLLVPWGTLHDTLRADTDAARAVLQGVRR